MTTRLLQILFPALFFSMFTLCGVGEARAAHPVNPAEVALFEMASVPEPSNEINIEVGEDEIGIKLAGRQLRVRNASGQTLEIYSVTGTKVAAYKVDCADKTIRLELPRGCYIVRIGDFARKISLI